VKEKEEMQEAIAEIENTLSKVMEIFFTKLLPYLRIADHRELIKPLGELCFHHETFLKSWRRFLEKIPMTESVN